MTRKDNEKRNIRNEDREERRGEEDTAVLCSILIKEKELKGKEGT